MLLLYIYNFWGAQQSFKIAMNQRKHCRAYLKASFVWHSSECKGQKQTERLEKGEIYTQSKCTNQKEQLNWHCVLNTNQLAGYTGTLLYIKGRWGLLPYKVLTVLLKTMAKRSNIVGQTFEICVTNNVLQFGYVAKNYLYTPSVILHGQIPYKFSNF